MCVCVMVVAHNTPLESVLKAEGELQSSGELLKEALERHKAVAQDLRELMDTAVELGLKSRVTHLTVCVLVTLDSDRRLCL